MGAEEFAGTIQMTLCTKRRRRPRAAQDIKFKQQQIRIFAEVLFPADTIGGKVRKMEVDAGTKLASCSRAARESW